MACANESKKAQEALRDESPWPKIACTPTQELSAVITCLLNFETFHPNVLRQSSPTARFENRRKIVTRLNAASWIGSILRISRSGIHGASAESKCPSGISTRVENIQKEQTPRKTQKLGDLCDRLSYRKSKSLLLVPVDYNWPYVVSTKFRS